MYALIRLGKGQYYGSTVFGYYKDEITAKDEYERYIQDLHSGYYVVFNPTKNCLWKWYSLQRDTKYLIPQLLVVDSDMNNWVKNDNETGGVDFLPKETADNIIETGIIPDDILEKCLSVENAYVFNEYPEVKTKQDIDNLEWATGGFHDARIAEQRMTDDGKLYLKFDGIWGCTAEVWFWGDVSYSTESRNPEYYDPYWFGSTVVLQDGFVYLIDDDDMTVEEIGEGYCWFKARHMQYHIIPN